MTTSRLSGHRTVLNLLVMLGSLLIAVCLAEGILRVMGYEPWQYLTLDRNEPTVHEPDPELGWRNRAGSYVIPPYHPDGHSIRVTFLDEGRRITSDESGPARPKIILLGGSFIQGWAISDDETLAWRLQLAFPEFEVINFGTGGYGTLQSLLTLERHLPSMQDVRMVIYGFSLTHEGRNVATEAWQRVLGSLSRRGHAEFPFASLDGSGEIQRHPPERYLALPGRTHSALIALLERKWMSAKSRPREQQKRAVTMRLIQELRDTAEQPGARSVVLLLFAPEADAKREYLDFLHSNRIAAVDCVFKLGKPHQVLGEGHPNGLMNERWFRCVAPEVKSWLDGSP